MMRTIRRHDLAPRIEMLPLIDVIFLLITFFIYSLNVMVRAQVLPVELTTLAAGGRPAGQQIEAVTIDRIGRYYFNQQPVTLEQLDSRLSKLAVEPDEPTIYVAVEEEGSVDRGPLLVSLIERINVAGIRHIAIVGQTKSN